MMAHDEMAGVYLAELEREEEEDQYDQVSLEFEKQKTLPWQQIGYFDDDEQMSDDDDPMEQFRLMQQTAGFRR